MYIYIQMGYNMFRMFFLQALRNAKKMIRMFFLQDLRNAKEMIRNPRVHVSHTT